MTHLRELLRSVTAYLLTYFRYCKGYVVRVSKIQHVVYEVSYNGRTPYMLSTIISSKRWLYATALSFCLLMLIIRVLVWQWPKWPYQRSSACWRHWAAAAHAVGPWVYQMFPLSSTWKTDSLQLQHLGSRNNYSSFSPAFKLQFLIKLSWFDLRNNQNRFHQTHFTGSKIRIPKFRLWLHGAPPHRPTSLGDLAALPQTA